MTRTIRLLILLVTSAWMAGPSVCIAIEEHGKIRATEVVITNGSKVTIDYSLIVAGKVIETTEGKEPLKFKYGSGDLMAGLEKQLTGMKVGEQRTLTVLADEAYGPVKSESVEKIPRSAFAEEMDLKQGMILPLKDKQGRTVPGMVQAVTDQFVVINLNHPLAGQDLVFDVKILDIR